MAISARILPREDYARLVGTELEAVWPTWPPTARVLVVEDATGTIIGCWGLLIVLHAEGVWIAPAHRKKGAVARALLQAMRTLVQEYGAESVMTAAVTPEIEAFCATLHGQRLPGSQWVLPLGV